MIEGKNILITGGTGSIGMGLAKQLLKYNPKEIRIFSRDELKQDDMRKKFNNNKLKSSNKQSSSTQINKHKRTSTTIN